MRTIRQVRTFLIAVSLGLLLAFVFGPLAALFGRAVMRPTGPVAALSAFGPLRQALLLARSLALALCAALGATAVGTVLGRAVFAQSSRAQKLFALLMVLPLLLPPFVVALAFIMLTDRIGVHWFGFGAAVFVLSLAFAPLAGLVVWAGFVRIGESSRAAAELGAGPWRVCTQVELGLIRPYLWTAFGLIGLFSFADYGVPSLLRVTTYPVVVFSHFAACYDLRGALLSCWPYALLPGLALAGWSRLFGSRLFRAAGRPAGQRDSQRARRARRIWCVMFGCVLFVCAALPILVLLATAGGPDAYAAAWRTGRRQLLTSLALSAGTATLLVLLGGAVAAGICASVGWRRVLQNYLSLLPAALPGTVFGIGLICAWNRPSTAPVYTSPAILVLLYLARFLPFAARTLLAGLNRITRETLDAARLADASAPRLFRVVLAPLWAPAALVGWSLCFVLCSRELTGTLLVAPPGMETLAVRIYSLYHYGAGRLVAALALLLVLTGFAAFAGAGLLLRSTRRWCVSKT